MHLQGIYWESKVTRLNMDNKQLFYDEKRRDYILLKIPLNNMCLIKKM